MSKGILPFLLKCELHFGMSPIYIPQLRTFFSFFFVVFVLRILMSICVRVYINVVIWCGCSLTLFFLFTYLCCLYVVLCDLVCRIFLIFSFIYLFFILWFGILSVRDVR